MKPLKLRFRRKCINLENVHSILGKKYQNKYDPLENISKKINQNISQVYLWGWDFKCPVHFSSCFGVCTFSIMCLGVDIFSLDLRSIGLLSLWIGSSINPGKFSAVIFSNIVSAPSLFPVLWLLIRHTLDPLSLSSCP